MTTPSPALTASTQSASSSTGGEGQREPSGLAERLRSKSLQVATSILSGLFGVGALLGIPQLWSGADPPAFFSPLAVSALCFGAFLLARNGRERMARRIFVVTLSVDLFLLMSLAAFELKQGLGFSLMILTVFLFHLTHESRAATSISGVLVVGLGFAYVVQGFSDVTPLTDWRVVTGAVAQLMVLGFSNVVLGRLGRDWTFALAEADQARTQLLEAHRLATQASRAKSHFLASMSHELRTPLNAIIGYSELAAEEAAADSEDLGHIRSAGRHLLSLVDQVLDLSRIEAGKLELERTEASLDRLVREVCDILRPQLQVHQNRLRLEAASLTPNSLDPLRTRQIVTNLLGNATKFTEHGEIVVEVSEKEGWQRVVVQDDGPGIPSHRLEDIFAPFEQADSDVQVNYGGTGLGLAISRRLAEEMGGRLWAESVLGEGATFIFELPLSGATRLRHPVSLRATHDKASH